MVILEEGNRPYPPRTKCNMFVSQKAFNSRPLATDFCCREEERKWRRLSEEEARAGTEMAMTAYRIPLDPFTSFKYLGRFFSEADGEWPAVVHHLQRARQK